MALRLYSILLTLLLPLLLLRLLWRSIEQPAYRHHWRQRLGLAQLPQSDIWIHAVSVGEAHLALHLIEHWRPDGTIIISCTTATGRSRITHWQQQHPQVQLYCTYLPFDLPIMMSRALRQTRPSMLLIMETEIWPRLLNTASTLAIPTALINARLSKRSAAGYKKVTHLICPAFSSFNLVLTQTRDDARRISCLGAKHCHVTGTMKCDFSVSYPQQQLNKIRQSMGQRECVWTIGSSRLGEEQLLLNAIDKLVQKHPNALVCWAPRHWQKSEQTIIKHLADKGYLFDKYSCQTADTQTNVLLIDTFGDIPLFYAYADFVFIGGTLVNTGSQNIIEPALLAKTIISGPSHYNFTLAHKVLKKSGALVLVTDQQTLHQTVLDLARDKSQCTKRGEAGKKAIQSCRGATATTINYLQQLYTTRIAYELD